MRMMRGAKNEQRSDTVKAILEELRDVQGYDGMYKISNTGKVYSQKRVRRIDKINNPSFVKEIKPRKDKFGYFYIGLYKDGVRKIFKVHRLVAEAFVDNPMGKKYINHIDENKSNNNSYNLEWVDFKQNVDYSGSRIVARVSQVGKIEKVYNSINEIKDDGYCPSTVTHIINKTRKINTHKNKRWIEIPREASKWENVF